MVICPVGARAVKKTGTASNDERDAALAHLLAPCPEAIMRNASTEKPRAFFRRGAVSALVWVAAGGWAMGAHSAEVIELTQTGCQFLEPEGKDHAFKTTKKEDCDRINAQNGSERIAKSKVVTLKPGEYVFRVTNKNVPYELGFWLREKDYDWKNPVHKLTKISVSGGGITTGKSQDYKVTLKPGEYAFSCPLNTTPDYRLVVTGG